MAGIEAYVRWLEDVDSRDAAEVGGKNASLGEMIRGLGSRGIRVPGGFATTAAAFREFCEANELDEPIRERLRALDQGAGLDEVGPAIRKRIGAASWPPAIESAIREAYRELSRREGVRTVEVAVRSSATAEDLPEASFAGQLETYLEVRGEKDVLEACRRCYASLFTNRAIAYRREQGLDRADLALSVGVQRMVRSDRGASGVLFTLDPESGFPGVVVIDGAWGLGETVVQGIVDPDEFRVFKPLLDREDLVPIVERRLGEKARQLVHAKGRSGGTRLVDTTPAERERYVLEDEEVLRLARWGVHIEEHYGRPMDVEWAKDGDTGDLYVVQARPETVHARKGAAALKTYRLTGRPGEPIARGLAIGEGIAAGRAIVLTGPDQIDRFEPGSILVTGMTDPDWVPILKQAAGIVTDHGGRTSHAAIVSRELGVPAVVGTGDATRRLRDGQEITVSCAEGAEGVVHEGLLEFVEEEIDLSSVPETRTRIQMNVASPEAALRWWRLPVRGIGLARMEFLVNEAIRIHPMALVRYDDLEDDDARRRIDELTRGYDDRAEYFVDRLAQGIARIAATRWPDPVVVRTSDFKTNEYAELVGGREFEPHEENPMLGFRGAARYTSERYEEGFALECRALRRVRERIGLENVVVMIPFVRTIAEADGVLEVLAREGLVRGRKGLRIYCMIEVPSNVVLADRFAERFDGFSIGSNDLTQLVLGVDRDSELLAEVFDERDEAVRRMISSLIETAHEKGVPVGICGQAPSDHPGFAEFLVEAGIDSISVAPDRVLDVIERVAAVEERLAVGAGR